MADMLQALEKVLQAKKLNHFHACANNRGAPGQGILPWEKILDLLRQYGYTGHITMETFVLGGLDSSWVQVHEEPDALALAQKKGWNLELLAHPGAVLEPEDIARLTNRSDIHFLTSSFREREASMYQLDAASGKKTSLSRTLFPNRSRLLTQYPYLQQQPYLLPIAWTQRLWRYAQSLKDNRANPSESTRIGKERIALLRRYGLIE